MKDGRTSGGRLFDVVAPGACAVLLFAGCTRGNESGRVTTAQQPEPAAEVHGTTSEPSVAMLELGKSDRRTLLELDGVGHFVASCDWNGRARITFVAAGLLPTSAVTVSSPALGTIRRTVHPSQTMTPPQRGSRADVQIWQIAPFSKGNHTVTTVWISRGRSAGGPYYSCGFSAQGFAATPAG
jgi:hypothetical protein